MSPSSHTRGHRESVDYTRELLVWLESHGRRVINGSRALALEISKVRQYEALRQAGLRTPHTVAVAGGPQTLKEAARHLPVPSSPSTTVAARAWGSNSSARLRPS
jgi:glutathione synthase/RimK-type ligase-like ATP-grasp enzyme